MKPRSSTRQDTKRARLSKAPLAIASDGSVLLNVGQLVTADDLATAVKEAHEQGGPVFIGVPMTMAEINLALAATDDAAAEIVARIGGRRRARR